MAAGDAMDADERVDGSDARIDAANATEHPVEDMHIKDERIEERLEERADDALEVKQETEYDGAREAAAEAENPVAAEAEAEAEEAAEEELFDEDEDEEELGNDEEDEDAEEEEGPRHPKKQRRNRFLDVEAEVDNDDEDVEEEEAEELLREEGFIADDMIDESREAQLRTASDNQRLDHVRRKEEEMSAEALAEELKQRHARNARFSSQSDYAEVPQRLLMPSVEDPGLWRIRCKRGRERHLVSTVMRRALSQEAIGKPLYILSAFCRDSLEGQIFVEARRADDVVAAFNGLAGVYVTNQKPFLVPILEMADLLKLQKKHTEVPVGGWIRIKRGKYAGDLGQVLDVAENGEEVGIKLVPRLDLNPSERDTYTDRSGRKRKKPMNASLTAMGFRPPQRLFNAEEVQRAYPHETPTKRGGTWLFGGETFRDGYLEKDFKVTALTTEEVNPSLDEVLRFTGEAPKGDGDPANGDGIDLQLLANASKRGLEETLQPGDHVEVFEGEQAGVTGRVETIEDEVVTLELPHEALDGQKIEVPAKSVRKQFRAGDHVKVLAGKHADETGLVVKVEDGITTFLSDLSLTEVSVFSKDIREAAEVGSGVNVIGGYELHNLVQLDAQTAGVIFNIERESFKVLDQNGHIVTVKPHQISMRRDTARSVALDHNGHEVHVGDMIKEVEWQLSQFRQGQVLHIYQSNLLFVHSRDYTENGGLFIVRSNQVEPLAPTAVKSSTQDLSRMNPALAEPSTEGGANAIAARRGGRDIFAGRHVSIVRGPYKTYRGIIKDTTGGMARVELHTMSKILTVPLDSMVEKNPVTGESRRLVGPPGPGMGAGMSRPATNPYSGMPGGMTPAYMGGAKTPAYNPYGGAQTPGYGGMGATPNPYAGGRTPGYAGMGATPNPYGGRTPAYGGMGATPNPYAGGRTPAHANMTPNPYGGRTPGYAGMGATPNPYGGAQTPAYGGMGMTPNPYGGATPAANPWASAPASAPAAAPQSLIDGIKVRIVRNFRGGSYQRGAYDGELGTLFSKNPVSCKVTLETGTQLADVPVECAEPVRPTGNAGEQCIVTDGAYRGSRVTMQSIDDGIAEVLNSSGQTQELAASSLALA
ncbi:Spt5p [Malassezia vespertilionis]|uniref:Transcription elongation factor SPT5 n=1 Tax=Malassezia vespertilionis TaxID=2020962 RepID=A0A2N1JF72_9BASI|nr:Spt5p [Malassezia vespertilionis]